MLAARARSYSDSAQAAVKARSRVGSPDSHAILSARSSSTGSFVVVARSVRTALTRPISGNSFAVQPESATATRSSPASMTESDGSLGIRGSKTSTCEAARSSSLAAARLSRPRVISGSSSASDVA